MLANAPDIGDKARVLDPAIGDGSLMEALVLRLDTPHVTGFDTDSKAVTAALSA